MVIVCSYFQAGANWIVSGTAVTGAADPEAVIKQLKNVTDSCLCNGETLPA